MITIFNTPILTPALRGLAKLTFRLTGWKVEGEFPETATSGVIIAAPHTSYWDFVIFLGLAFVYRRCPQVLIKHTVFWWPLGMFLSYCGALPVNRTKPQSLTRDVAKIFDAHDELLLVITPEGTRRPVIEWKSGFYRIAEKAHVPIIIGFIDGKNRKTGIDSLLTPSGDYERDLTKIRKFYAKIEGIRKENYLP